MSNQSQDTKDLERELKAVLRAIESAKVSVANELGKGGNLPYAHSHLQNAEHKLKRALRNLK
ncbi:hypothetical protein LL998_34090 (plasmid) [Burkholderia ambifaria]|uniref:hypothetical protein n=1 Tax=Burkholderia ambifaria TaxID=152480 RepID=UPI001E3453AA|nr:hypothetical protein [Burkholderia ambifaria]UEP39772.1 hypothetical protein LL998_34090 [Burkholderia ambifaria]